MTSKVVEQYYRPRPWVYGISGLFFLMAGLLFFLPRFDQWVLEKRITAATDAKQSEVAEDPAIALLQKEAQSYEVWLQKEPTNQRALRGLIDSRLQLGDVNGAVAPLETLARQNQGNEDYAILLGQVKQKAKDYEGAAAEFKKILFTDATHIKALQGMVDLMLEQNRPEGAIGLLQQTLKDMGKPTVDDTIELDPEKVTSIQLMLGQVYMDQERTTEAIAIYDQAASINKTDFRPVLAKALVLKEQGKDSEAKPLFTTAVTLAPAKYRDQIKEMAVFDQTELEVIEAAESALTEEPETETPAEAE